MKTILTFIRIWLTIVLLFSFLLLFPDLLSNRHVESVPGIIGLTFVFSIPPAIILLIVLLVASSTIWSVKSGILFIYFSAMVSIIVYGTWLNLNFDLSAMYLMMGQMCISVFGSLLIWTKSIVGIMEKELPDETKNEDEPTRIF